MFSFSKKATPVLGVDISSSAVKILELSHRSNKYKVESYAIEPLPANAVSDNVINDIEVVGEAIDRATKKSKTRLKDAAVAVTGSSVITKVITMPAGLTEDEMESQIRIEADQYIPFPLEEVAMDFEVTGESQDDSSAVDVLLAASRSENVDNVVAALELGGLTAKIVDIEAYAIENTINLMMNNFLVGSPSSTIAVADVGSAATVFNVLENRKTIYSREGSFGGAQLTEEIQRRYGLSYEEAVVAKKQGGLPDDYEAEVLEPFKENMASQIERSLQFFFASSQTAEISSLVLAGGCASIPQIADFIGEKLSIETVIASPFAEMAMSGRISKQSLSNDAPAMLIACGLALRGWS